MPACGGDALAVSVGQMAFGLGNVGLPVRFRNIGPAPCHLDGYPGVDGLDATAHEVVQAIRTPTAYLGGLTPGATIPPVVELVPGGVASALLAGGDNPIGHATTCSSYPALLVTPPGATRSFHVTLGTAFPGCAGLLITPVVQGSTGSQW
jgi:Protein of unknown function (DUF4232)